MARTALFFWLSQRVQAALKTTALQPNKEHISVDPTHQPYNRPQTVTPNNVLMAPISRRTFLKGMASATAAVFLAPTVLGSAQHTLAATRETALTIPLKTVPSTPIAIVGGGLGGLVTAYRLSQQGIPCEIYEANTRLGGRVFTQNNFNRDNMFVELGGELVDTGHTDLIDLCRELNVPLEEFAPFDKGFAPAVFFSGGHIHTEEEVLEAFQPLAKAMAEDIRLCFPSGEIEMPTYREPFNTGWLDKISLETYLNNQTQVAPWLIRLIKAAYTGEYGRDPAEQSALNLLLLIGTDTSEGLRMFGESDEAMRIQGGNSRIVEALLKALKGKVPIYTRHALTRVSMQQDDLVLQFKTQNRTLQKITRQAVLALPFSILRDVEGVFDLPLSAVKKQCIAEWGYGTNSKQMIGFRKRFWRENQDGVPAHTGELYSDLERQCFWETSRLQPGKSGILTNFMGGETGKNATADSWSQALHNLTLIYPHINQYADGKRAFFNWSRNPWAKGSYTCPKPGQYTALMGAAGEPEMDGRLFFAGEHCSVDWAGYMNGAAQSGNVAARQIVANRPTAQAKQDVPVLIK